MSLSADEAQALYDEFYSYLEEAFQATKSYKPNEADFLGGAWEGLSLPDQGPRRGDTSAIERKSYTCW